jgi:hypothetical protein
MRCVKEQLIEEREAVIILLYESNREGLVVRNKTNALKAAKTAHVGAGGFAMEAVDSDTEPELRRLDVTPNLTALTRLIV